MSGGCCFTEPFRGLSVVQFLPFQVSRQWEKQVALPEPSFHFFNTTNPIKGIILHNPFYAGKDKAPGPAPGREPPGPRLRWFVPGPEALGVHPPRQLAQGGASCCVTAEQLPDCFGFPWHRVDAARVLRVAGQCWLLPIDL